MPTRVYIPTEPYTPTGESVYAQPAPDNELLARPPEPQGALSRGINRLLGTQFAEERYQTWPEKMVRSAATLAGDVVSGAVPVLPPGSRREDFTDEPAPGVPDNAPWWRMAPVAAQPNDLMMERAQDLAGVVMGGGIGGTGKAAMAGEAVLGSGPVRNPNGTRRIEMSRYNQDAETAGILFDQADAWKTTGAKPEVVKLDPAELRSTQNTFEDGVGHGGGFKDMNDKPLVARTPDGELHILDGHHRLEGAAAKGKKLDSYVIDVPGDPAISGGGKTLRSGMGDEGTGPVPLNQKGPPWFSAVENALENTTMGSAPGAQWLATLRNARGVKPEEMAWLGLDDMLAEAQLAGRKVTRAEIQDHIKSHQVELRDVEKANYKNMDRKQAEREAELQGFERHDPFFEEAVEQNMLTAADERPGGGTKYHDYQLPGGENYREHLITMPKRVDREIERLSKLSKSSDAAERDAASAQLLEREFENPLGNEGDNYKSSHWDEPNILAHVRTNDRVIDGKKALHLEEVQSDWHQQGRDRGYKTGERPATSQEIEQGLARTNRDGELVMGAHGVPDAPFKKSWHELALKRMLRRAAEEGYERLSWTPGDAQAARYDLSKQVKRIHLSNAVFDENNNLVRGVLNADGPSGGTVLHNQDVTGANIADYIGKDAAEKLVNKPTRYDGPADRPQTHILEGDDLRAGGNGMRAFYDSIIPKALQKIGKEHGVKVQRGGLPGERPSKPFDVYVDGKKVESFQLRDQADAVYNDSLPNVEIREKKTPEQPIFYIDIPQSLRDAAMRKGFPLFSGGKMFVPHQEEDK